MGASPRGERGSRALRNVCKALSVLGYLGYWLPSFLKETVNLVR